ncbi:MAG: hypothetical protein R3F59_01140 [Myxococcota bacterium]
MLAQFTVISSQLAAAFPLDGVAPVDATESWRRALAYARQPDVDEDDDDGEGELDAPVEPRREDVALRAALR